MQVELLSEVMGIHIYERKKSAQTSIIRYAFDAIGERRDGSINIYELAHKCKEWALDNRYIITTMPNLTEKKWRNTSIRLLHFYSSRKDRHIQQHHPDNRFEGDTEAEAVFKACEWILKYKEV